jgi:hypothetical protein
MSINAKSMKYDKPNFQNHFRQNPFKVLTNFDSKTTSTSKSSPTMGALLSEIWRIDPRVPSIVSRRAWALANGYDPRKVNQWFNRRKAADKKAGRRVSEELYELSVDASTSSLSLAKDKDTTLGGEDSVSDGADLARSSGSRSSSVMPPSDWTVNSFPSSPLRFLSPFPATEVRSSVDLTHNAGTKISTSAFRGETDSVDFADPLSISRRNLARVYAPAPVSGTTLATAARTLEDLAELPCSPYFSVSTPAALDPCTNPDCLLCAPEGIVAQPSDLLHADNASHSLFLAT